MMRRNGIGELRALFIAVIACGLCLALTYGLSAAFRPLNAKQPSAAKVARDADETIARGHKLFLVHCAECHGFNARGADDGPGLYNLREGDTLIEQVIRDGVKREMPAFGRKLSDADVRLLIAYLRSLKDRQVPGTASSS